MISSPGFRQAIAKHIVEMMGGHIEVESALGEGSEFSFTADLAREVPVAADAGRPAASERAESSGAEIQPMPVVTDDFSGYHILLVEDVDINREIVLALLEPTHLAIDCAENGVEALAKYTADPGRYDMIFMDIQMPEMDGYEATGRIRALEKDSGRHIPIIAMTANVFREDVEKSIAVGMDSHVGKPIDFEEVLSKIRTCLRKK